MGSTPIVNKVLPKCLEVASTGSVAEHISHIGAIHKKSSLNNHYIILDLTGELVNDGTHKAPVSSTGSIKSVQKMKCTPYITLVF